jgi:hypothetical protein
VGCRTFPKCPPNAPPAGDPSECNGGHRSPVALNVATNPTRLATSFLSIPTAFCLVRIWSSNSSCTGYIFTFWKPTTSFFNILPIRHARAKWNIYGVFLPNEVLHRVYRNNAKRLLKNLA